MIIGVAFDGDVFDDVKRLQQEHYGQALERIYRLAVSKFKQAERILQARSELGREHPLSNFDHRALQGMHDQIAAFFRYSYSEKLHPELPGVSEHESHEGRIIRLWLTFLDDELARLYGEYPDLVRLVLVATAYPNPDERGSGAEKTLQRFLQEIYVELNEWSALGKVAQEGSIE